MKGFEEAGGFGSDVGLSENAVIAEFDVYSADFRALGLLERLLGRLGDFEEKLFEELVNLLERVLSDLSSAGVILEDLFDVAVASEFARHDGRLSGAGQERPCPLVCPKFRNKDLPDALDSNASIPPRKLVLAPSTPAE